MAQFTPVVEDHFGGFAPAIHGAKEFGVINKANKGGDCGGGQIQLGGPRGERRGQRKRLALAGVLVVTLSACVAFGCRYPLVPEEPTPDRRHPSGTPKAPRDQPLAVRPTLSLRGALDDRGVRAALDRLRLDRLPTMSHALHLLRLFGPGEECRYALDRRASVLDIILDDAKSRACFQGNPSLIDTRYGVRSPVVIPRDAQWQRERQAHEDQLLAVLAEAGVPLSQLVTTSGGTRAVRHLLADTVANFDPRQAEIEWSALAIVLYVPPLDSWADKFGHTYHFDDLARELMNRPLSQSLPCGGTHLLYTMAMLLRVGEQEAVLSPPVQGRLRAVLQEHVAKAARSQTPRGTWDSEWYKEESGETLDSSAPGKDTTTEVHITGHQIEWLMLLPADMRPQPDCFLRALRWLQVALVNGDRKTIVERYCPYSHAGRVLKVLALEGGGVAPTPDARLP